MEGIMSIKKPILAASAVLLLAAVHPLRAEDQPSFRLGIKAGPSYSNVNWSQDDGSGDPFRRLTFGLLAEFSLSPRFAIQPELDLVTMGFSWRDASPAEGTKHVDGLSYLHVPVLFKVRLLHPGWIVPAVFAGPVLGILTSAHASDYDAYGNVIFQGDIKHLYRQADFGAAAGAGADIQVRNLRLLLDVRYYLGFMDVSTSEGFVVKNAALMITAGLGF
jgi:Outer membrane protein beta-barrel domain